MVFEVVLPRLGWSMESGRLVEWLKKDGETVQVGEMLFSVEGDKAIQEVEALESGILRIRPGAPGPDEDIPVGTLLAYICQPGETPPFVTQTFQAAQPVNDLMPAKGQQPRGEDIYHAINRGEVVESGKVKISPRARRLARELAIDWTGLTGSGTTGRIREKDIQAAAAARQAAPLARTTTQAKTQIQPLESAAARITLDIKRIAPVTLMIDCEVTRLYELIEGWKSSPNLAGQVIPSFTDMIIKLTSHVLQEFPGLNASLENNELVFSRDVHIGIFVDTETGEVFPVIQNAAQKGLKTIASEAAQLIEKAHSGRLTPGEVKGATFTISDLGIYGVDAYTPLIFPAQCAVLGLGRAAPRVVSNENGIPSVKQMVTLCLTFDHRIVDGAPAARFLKRLKELVEDPVYWLIL